ncbi:SDR family NAD(P)-dependent oxidoreductase [Kineobactrum salinum]|uniref:SDR family NAD(P)-dependent oxidoreductase n=1 Tax=Kineobactrum salinum TaxID=2708301 RepID=A0A6C0U048_9GAMM|nr:SDR family NAD(P)-dependent oxidoreductase [Kineobactrum salinum]QIB65288.1 SDR family NAD(P)-dependent oxidoreductase [Kineobactrum salinum]
MSKLLKIIKFYGRFMPSFSAIGYYSRSLFWPRLEADFSGQTWLVTGASGGIGGAIALEAARRGATVLAAARSEQKLAALAGEPAAGGRIVPLVADLSLMSGTAAMVERIRTEGRQLDVLVNNVGVLLHEHQLTAEGKEASYALNILNHFLLTEQLLEGELLNRGGTVINMSSGGMYNAPLMVNRMNVTAPEHYNGVLAYAVHKRGQAELTKYWQSHYGAARDLKFYVMHPGWTDTEGVQTAMPKFRRILKLVLRSGLQGGDTAIWLAAKRPDADPAAFWLDRKPRAAHAYPATRNSKFAPEDLAAFLQTEIDGRND